MTLSEPIVFEPLSMERVWGGRRLETLFGKSIPQGAPIGESWEVVDREEAQSVVHEGKLRGATLHELWTTHREELFGRKCPDSERFPLLIKLLDARETLSVQVHPPAALAEILRGQPKTEMWYFLHCEPTAHIFVGLKNDMSRHHFENLLSKGKVEEALHRIDVRAGDSIFIPSGRMHAIGGGSVIAEIQQNSDTTYRVFDWNRLGMDQRPRMLHIEESLRSIDFEDFEPGLIQPKGEELVRCPEFEVERWDLKGPRAAIENGVFAIFLCIEGSVKAPEKVFNPGDVFMIPACMSGTELVPVDGRARVLKATLPCG